MSSSSSEDSEFDLDVPVVPRLFTLPINRNIDDVPIDSVFNDADRNEVLDHHHNSGDGDCNMAGHDNEEEYEEGHGVGMMMMIGRTLSMMMRRGTMRMMRRAMMTRREAVGCLLLKPHLLGAERLEEHLAPKFE